MSKHVVGKKGQRNQSTGLLAFFDGGDGDNGNDSGNDNGRGAGKAAASGMGGDGEGGWGGATHDGGGMSQGLLNRQGLMDRVASFGFFGNDLGSGALRARTADEMNSYGISQNDLAGLKAGAMDSIAPGASMPAMANKLAMAGTMMAGPFGAAAGAITGTAMDNAALKGALNSLGFDNKLSSAIAAGKTAPSVMSRITSPMIGMVAGPYASLANSMFGNPLANAVSNTAFDSTYSGMSPADRVSGQQGGRFPPQTLWS